MFLKHPIDVKVDVYESVAVLCEVFGFGNVKVQWKRIGFKLPATSRTHARKEENIVTSILEIARISGYYAGEYYCIARNGAGEVTSQMAKLSTQGTNKCK